MNQEASARAFGKSAVFQVPGLFAEGHKPHRGFFVYPRFMHDNFGLKFSVRIAEFERQKTLSRALFQVFKNALISRIVRQRQQELGRSLEYFSPFLYGKYSPVISERMDHNRRIFSRLDDFVEIAEPPDLHSPGKWTVDPEGFTAFHQIPSDKIGCGQVVVARNSD